MEQLTKQTLQEFILTVPQETKSIITDKESHVKTKGRKPMRIDIKYHADIPEIQQVVGSDWIDLRAAEDVTIHKGEFKLISLGISMKLPEGFEAHIVPRSSTFKKWGIIQCNHMAVIDNAYQGDKDVWKYPVYCLEGRNLDGETTTIKKGDRICQFRIEAVQPKIEFNKVDFLSDDNRGGFGSTGSK